MLSTAYFIVWWFLAESDIAVLALYMQSVLFVRYLYMTFSLLNVCDVFGL